MASEIIKKRLEELKSEGKLDAGFIDILIASNANDEEADDTVAKITTLIGKRHAENKEGKT